MDEEQSILRWSLFESKVQSQDVWHEKVDLSTTQCTSSNQTAAVCTMVKDMESYIDEWVDYHTALGFCKFYIYVNEDYFVMQHWARAKGPHVELIHYPGEAMQNSAFQNCAEKVQVTTNHTWVGFFDIDEFLVFRNWTYTNVIDFLQIYCESGSVSMNWVLFGSCITDEYTPVPILKRCQFRADKVWTLIKTIAKVSDMNISIPINNPHYVHLNEGKFRLDTYGKKINGRHKHLNGRRPANVSVFYHFHFKSRKEYIEKRSRGRADVPLNDSSNEHLVQEAQKGVYDDVPFDVHDDSAWIFLKNHVPKYAYYDNMTNILPTVSS